MTTDPQGELLIRVDNNNQIIGSITRKEAHESKGIYYRTIFVLVINNSGQVLIQKRSHTKDLYPNCWDLSVGGHVNYGLSYGQTAVKELQEELGLAISEQDMVTKGDVLVTLPNSFEYFRVFEYYLKPNQRISTSIEEILEIRWMAIQEIKKTMKNKSLRWYDRPEQVIGALY